LAKADEGTVQFTFDHANNCTLLSVAPKKNKRVVFLSTMHSGGEKKKTDEDTGKEEINLFYNQEKGGVDIHQMCSLYTTARKTNRWQLRLFYGMNDSAALNAFVIFTENVPNFGEHKKDKRKNS
jgi:hypothetical protein